MGKRREKISFYYGRMSPGLIALILGLAGLYFGPPGTPSEILKWFLGFLVLIGLAVIVGAIVTPFDHVQVSGMDETDILNKEQLTESDKAMLTAEYGHAQEMHNYYGRITWEIAGILLGGAVAALALSFNIQSSTVSATVLASVGLLVVVFYLLIRRHSRVAELHLVRCREIEQRLGLRQHLFVKEATYPCGVWAEGKFIRVPGPTGWQITQLLVFGLVSVALVLAAFRLIGG